MMKKILFILSLLFLTSFLYSQKVDTIIVNKEYKSYFSYEVKNPLFVIYKLYKGGGNVPRTGMDFKTDGLKYSLTDKDYLKSGYDIGHLANAKDFAYSEESEEKTFRYYNALPQTPRLNRGIWKSYESKLRELSQNDSFLIIAGGYNYIKINSLYVPKYCYKIVKNLVTKNVKCVVFNNDNSETKSEIKIEVLYSYLRYDVNHIKNTLK